MIETIVGGLVLAAVSALTWLAYNQPSDFKAVSPRIFLATLWVNSLMIVWWFSSLYTEQSILGGLVEAKLHDAAVKGKEYGAGSGYEYAVGSLAILAWMIFLGMLEFWVTKLKKPD